MLLLSCDQCWYSAAAVFSLITARDKCIVAFSVIFGQAMPECVRISVAVQLCEWSGVNCH